MKNILSGLKYLSIYYLLFLLQFVFITSSFGFSEKKVYPSPDLAPLSSISVFTWLDYDKNGIKSPTEVPVGGISLILYNEHNNLIATGITDQNGNYVFSNIPNGEYRIKFSRFAGLTYTYKDKGNNDDLDSDIDISGYSDFFTVNPGTDLYNITGGYKGNLQVFLGNNKVICAGQDVNLTALTYFGKSPFTYNWDNGLGENPDILVSPFTTTTYRVTVTDAWGFSAENEITLKVKNGVGEERITVIDGFFSGSSNGKLYLQVKQADPGPKYFTDYSDTGIISNYRKVGLTYLSGLHSATLEIKYDDASFSHSNDIGTSSYTSLCYNNNGAGMNLDVTKFDYFRFRDLAIDQGVLDVNITLRDINNNYTSVEEKLPGLGGFVLFNKEVFITKFDSVNVDLHHIAEICIEFSSMDISMDFKLDDIWLCKFTDCPLKTIPDNMEMCLGDTVELYVNVECVEAISYEWDHNLGFGQKHKVSPKETTTYYVTATDAYGCTSTDTVRVVVNPKPEILLDDFVEMCKGDSIEITAQGTGGIEPYHYLWNTGDTTATIKVSPEASTFYSVIVSDVNLCSSDEKSVNVVVHPVPVIDVTSTIANCAESDGSATAIATGGEPPYSFVWGDGSTGSELQNVPAGQYYVTVYDANGCQADTMIAVAEKDCGLIGDYVWEDMNANGIQEQNEPAIKNVEVILYDGQNSPLDTTYTDDLGNYYFYSLHQGQYFVKFIQPQNYLPTTKNVGDDIFDSDVDENTGITEIIDLQKYEKDSTIDAGFYRFASIGDTVWVDNNGNDIQDSGEKGIAGFEVQLEDCNGQYMDKTYTDSKGKYNFTGLKPGSYRLKFILPDSMRFVNKDAGIDDSKDSDVNSASSLTDCKTLVSGDNFTDFDAGVYVPAELGDFVWEDMNANGVQDTGEPGLSGVEVILNDCQGNPLDTLITDSTGHYLFENLKPGEYTISVIIPQDYYLSDANTTGDESDSDIESSGYSICEFLESGEKNHSYDIGLYRRASIGDRVWEDMNANGIQDSGEQGVANATVELYSCADLLLDTKVTDALGKYLFDSLKPGEYKIKFVLPDNYYFSVQDSTDDDSDSDANIVTGFTVCEELISGENNFTYDAGIYRYAKIGDYIWLDEDGNGIQDDNEPGFENVKVVLQDCEGNDLSIQYSDAAGKYLFDGLIPGEYALKFFAPQDYSFTIQDAGEDDIDSDVDYLSGTTVCVALNSNEDNRTYDAGLLYFGSLGDYVWEDMNGDGLQQADEPPLANVELKLYHWENNVFVYKTNTFTEANGKYLFDKLVPGDYYLKIIPPEGYDVTLSDKSMDDSIDSDFDQFNGENTTEVVNIGPGEDDLSWDAGLYRCATIGDLLWRDHVRDDVYTVGEAGINGVTVNLWRNDNGNWLLWDQVVTSYKPASTCGDGYWSFCTNPGEYYVEFSGIENTGMIHVTPNVGNDENIDSDIDDSNGDNTSAVFTLTSGQFTDNLDGGYFPVYNISGTTWKDENENGVRDSNEELFSNITVELYNNSGLVGTTVTDNNGEYHFEDLVEDNYYLWFYLPSNYIFTNPNAGNDDVDSDVTDDNGANTTSYIDLENDSLGHVDAGYIYQNQNGLKWNGVGGQNIDDYNLIWWNTAHDESVEYYEVFKGFGEEELDMIINSINSNKSEVNSYQLKDYDITRVGTYKYKIAAVKVDSSNNFSNEILVDVNKKAGMSIFPNPVESVLNFKFVSAKGDDISIFIMDLKGQILYKQESIQVQANKKVHREIQLDMLKNGIYELLVKTSGDRYIMKFTKISF